MPTGLRASGHDNVQTRDHTRVEELRCLSGQRAELDQVAEPRRLDDELADVDRSEGNHGWIDAAVPEKLHLLSQAEGTRRVTERCVIAAPLCCQGRGPVAVEGAPALVAVKVVRPVGRSTLTAPTRRCGGLAAGAAWLF